MDNIKDIKWIQGLVSERGLARVLGIEVLECSDGYCKGRIVMEEKHENPYGWAHGGTLTTLADVIAGVAASTAGNYVATVDMNFHFLKTGTNTKELICISRILKNGRTLLVVEAEITNDSGELLGKGDITYFNLNKKIEMADCNV